MKAEWKTTRGIEAWTYDKLHVPGARIEAYYHSRTGHRIYALIHANLDCWELVWKRTYRRHGDAIRGIWRALLAIRENAHVGSRQWQVATKAIEALNEAEKAAGRKTWPISRVTQVPDGFPTASQGNSGKAESQTEFQRYAQAFLENVARELDIDIPDGGLRVTWAKGQPWIDPKGTSAP